MKVFAPVAIFFLVGACSAASLGGLQEVKDTKSAEFVAILNLASGHASNLVETENQAKVTQLLSAHQQVVGGMMYHLDFELKETVCAKGEDKNLDDCEVKPEGGHFLCEVQVWTRSWENFTKVASAVCHPIQSQTVAPDN
ncbi:Cystatin-1 [Halotydeus destructor]|nr:Cystatin-1 [Halotydeus destructor]